MWLVAKYGMVAHSTPQVSLQVVIHYLLITKSFVNGLENIALWNCSWKFVCLVVVFSGAEMWSSKAPDCQDVGKKILLSEHCNINCSSEKRERKLLIT